MNATGVVLRGEPRAFHITSDPQTFVAYAPWGVGLRCAVVYRARGHDVCGWWVRAVGAGYQTAFLSLSTAGPCPFADAEASNAGAAADQQFRSASRARSQRRCRLDLRG